MSNLPIKDASNATRKVDVFLRTEGPDTVEVQAVALVDPATGHALVPTGDGKMPVEVAALPLPAGAATQATLAALNVIAAAVQSAVEALNGKTAAVDTSAIAGTVALDGPTLAALESITANTGGLTDAQLRAAALPVAGTFWQATQPVSFTWAGLTDTQLRASALPVAGTFWQATQPVSGTFWQATQPVSAAALPLPAGAATEATLAGVVTGTQFNARTPALGNAAPSAASPVVLAQDVSVLSSATQTVINTDLLTETVSGWYDAQAFHSATLQIIGSAGISAGAVFFEQTNDTTNAPSGVSWPVLESPGISANPVIAAITIAASTVRMFEAPVAARYVRVRISTAFVGGTVRVAAVFSQQPYAATRLNVQQATAANFLATVSGTVTANIGTGALAAGTNAIGDVGVQYRANATGAASGGHLVAAATTNPTVVKASAGRVLGWSLCNTTASWVYVKLHNSASAPTAGAGVVRTIGIPPNGKSEQTIDGGVAFTTGIALTTVTGATDADATAVAASAIVGDIFFA